MSPWGSPADRSEPGGPEPFSRDAAVVGTDIRGERINGAPRGALGVRIGDARPGSRRCVSAAAAATRRHSSSQAATDKKYWASTPRSLSPASADSTSKFATAYIGGGKFEETRGGFGGEILVGFLPSRIRIAGF